MSTFKHAQGELGYIQSPIWAGDLILTVDGSDVKHSPQPLEEILRGDNLEMSSLTFLVKSLGGGVVYTVRILRHHEFGGRGQRVLF